MELEEWLAACGLSRHADTFRANDVDLDVLRTLTEADLKELGLSLGDRKRLLQAVAAMAVVTAPPAPAPAPATPSSEASLAERRH